MVTDAPPVTIARAAGLDAPGGWDKFVKEFGPQFRAWALRAGAWLQDLDEVVQASLVRVWRAAPATEYDPAHGTFKKWLCTIVRREASSHRLAALRRCNRERPAARGEMVKVLAPAEPDPVEAADERRHQLAVLRDAMRAARADYGAQTWQVFLLGGVEDRPAEDVARALGVNVTNVWTTKSRVLTRIRREIAPKSQVG